MMNIQKRWDLSRSLPWALVALLAFFLGKKSNLTPKLEARDLPAHGMSPRNLDFQGRRVGGGPIKKPDPRKGVGGTKPQPLVYEGGGGSSGAAGDLIAVTGSYGVGQQVLYVLDAKNKQLAVYEARGGAKSTRRLIFVGARRIDLDLRLNAFNDDSDLGYEDLYKRFKQKGLETGTGK
jgi:hypothetical protein